MTAYARLTDPETAQEAGRRAAQPDRLTDGQRRVLAALRTAHANGRDGLTDFEHDRQQTSAGKRRKELQDAGLVADSGNRRPSPSGTPVIVWTITPTGLNT